MRRGWPSAQGCRRYTFLDPQTGATWLGTDAGLTYGMDPYGGWYAVAGDQVQPLTGMPPDAPMWPA